SRPNYVKYPAIWLVTKTIYGESGMRLNNYRHLVQKLKSGGGWDYKFLEAIDKYIKKRKIYKTNTTPQQKIQIAKDWKIKNEIDKIKININIIIALVFSLFLCSSLFFWIIIFSIWTK
ncbi:MAG: hypothetical protein KAS32_21710, partial [Candidatus Peribacteraceae bacterium]|nr:hypothetical protein [Candidatus Peribacteraceae bacterium]